MKSRAAKLMLLPISFLMAACSFNAPRSVIIGDIEIDLFFLIGFLFVMALALFFMFVWPPRKQN